MSVQTRKTADVTVNLLVFFSNFIAIGMHFVGGPDALGAQGTIIFRYFTIDSNILAAVASLCLLAWLLSGKDEMPRWLQCLAVAGTTAVGVTLITVLVFLAPMEALDRGLKGYLALFEGKSFVLHFSSPVLSIVSFCFLGSAPIKERKAPIFGLLPTVVYSIFYMFFVLVAKRWRDFYGFTFGGKLAVVPVVLVVMYLFSFGLTTLLVKTRNHFSA